MTPTVVFVHGGLHRLDRHARCARGGRRVFPGDYIGDERAARAIQPAVSILVLAQRGAPLTYATACPLPHRA